MESPYSCPIALLPPPPLSHQVPESSNLHPTSTTDAKGELLLRRGTEWAEEGLGRCTSRGEIRLASSSRRAEDVGGIKNGCQGVASCQVRSLGFRESYGTQQLFNPDDKPNVKASSHPSTHLPPATFRSDTSCPKHVCSGVCTDLRVVDLLLFFRDEYAPRLSSELRE